MRSKLRNVALRTIAVLSLLIAPQDTHAAPPQNGRRAVVTRVQPAYPELARRMGISGDVIIPVNILADGSASQTPIESGHALLQPAANEAVLRWRFAVARVSSECTVTIDFGAGE